MRPKPERPRELPVDPGGIGVRYFELYEALAAEGSALAYPRVYNRGTGKWATNTAVRRTIYSGRTGVTGSALDIVACVYMPTPRRWEVIDKPSQRRVRLRNDFAGIVPAYGVLEVAAPITLDGIQVFPVNRPTTSFKRLYLVNGEDPIADDGFGWGSWLLDADWVLYDDADTPAIGESWGPQDGSFELKKYRYGFTIWGNPTGGSTDLVQAQQMWVNEVYGQTSSTHSKGSSSTIDLYDGNNAAMTGYSITATNRFANVAASKKVICTWIGGTWLTSSAEC